MPQRDPVTVLLEYLLLATGATLATLLLSAALAAALHSLRLLP